MDPNEPGRKKTSPADLNESIKARLPRAVLPPPVQEPEQPPEETSPNKTIRRADSQSMKNDQVVAGLYILTILVLFFVVVRYIVAADLDEETLIFFGLPLLAIGYLTREVLSKVSGKN